MSELIFVEQKPMAGKEHIPQPGTTIGREGSDINIADPEVSRRHATIRSEGGAVAIEDLNSTNGTFVNGERITGMRVLSEGDEVRFGMTVWKLQPAAQKTAIADAPAAPAPPQVTAARQVPSDLPPQPAQPPAPQPPAPQPPAAQPPAPQPPAPQPTAQQPAAPRPPAPAPPPPGGAPAGARGDVPAPEFQPSAIRRVVPPPGGPAAFNPVPTARRRGSAATRVGATIAATIVVVAVAAAVVAYYVIEPFQPTAGDPGVTAAISEFAEAIADGDGDSACALLTEDAQEEVAESAGGDCEAAFDAAGEQLDDDEKDELNDIEPDDVEVDGDRATATVPEIGGGGDTEFELVREDGDWLISDLGS